MVSKSDILSLIQQMPIYDTMVNGCVIAECTNFSDKIREVLSDNNIPVLMVGDHCHTFLITETDDFGIMILDATAHQFEMFDEWVFMPVQDVVDKIKNRRPDIRIWGYWVGEIEVSNKYKFDAEYGIGINKIEREFLDRISVPIEKSGIRLIDVDREEQNRMRAESALNCLMVSLDSLTKKSTIECMKSQGSSIVSIHPSYIQSEREEVIAKSRVFYMYERDAAEVTNVINSRWCPEWIKGKQILPAEERESNIQKGGVAR